MALDAKTIAILAGVSAATITTVLLKKGLRNVWMRGSKPLAAGQARVVGRAFTMRFIPAREDLATPAQWSSPKSSRIAVESMPEGCIAVVDAMGVTHAGILGDILVARMKARGVAALVTDGAVRDAQGVAATRIARYATLSGASAPVITTQPLPLQGCGSQQPMRTLSVTASSSNSLPLRYQWRRNGHDLCNSSSVSGVNSPDLVLTRSGTDGGAYEVVVFTEQGCATSSRATVVDCAADFNCSGQLEVADLMEYVTSWLSGDLRADRNRDSQLTYSDLYYFVGDWFRGCGY